MRKRIVRSRVILSAALVLVTSPSVFAQQKPDPQTTETLKVQVEGFERSLLGAIDSAAGQMNQRVREAYPGVPVGLRYSALPIVSGIVLPDVGPVFYVLIPGIEPVDLSILKMYAPRIQAPVAGRPGEATRVSGAGIVADDPVKPPVPPLTDPDQEYTALMRVALVSAVLEHAVTVTVPTGQALTVIAGELPTGPASPFNPRSRALILQIKSEDLVALRENRLTREEAKARIKESKYPN